MKSVLRFAFAAAAVCAATAVVSAIVVAATAARRAPVGATFDGSFRSRALGSRIHFLVHLPPGYDRGTTRYPVVYFLHGLPADPASYLGVAWVGDALDRTGKHAILVVPQGTRRADGDPEYHDWGPGRNWETALAVDLPRFVDDHYRTIASRSGRAIVGVSAGGYGAAILGLHHLDEFSAIESWSGYFRPTTPSGAATLDVGDDADDAYASVHALVPGLAKQLRRFPTFLAFYVGRDDRTFLEDDLRLDRELSAADVAHTFRLYPGGHEHSLWASRATDWLALALDRLSPPIDA